MIYLDNAATTMVKPDCVIDAVVDGMRKMGNASRGAHEQALSADRIIYKTRRQLAQLFGVLSPSQVAFTKNSTEALNVALCGLLSPGDHVVTTAIEHNSVLRPIYRLAEKGVDYTIVPADDMGRIDPAAVDMAMTNKTRVLVTTHASNVTGNVTDIEALGQIAKAHGVYFILDASQTAGVFPIDMEAMHISVVCFTGHKGLLGPQGTGGICVSKNCVISPLLVGGSGVHSFAHYQPEVMPVALEAGTLNGHGIAGLSAAISYIEAQGMDALRQKEQALAKQFYEGVRSIDGIQFYGDYDQKNRGAIVALNLGEEDAGVISDCLSQQYDIATRPGAHCAPLMHKTFKTEAQGIVRFSFSHMNNEEEVEAAIRAMKEIASSRCK
ncbi:MAG: aminotransferase class V-fold PLP-dependent enzyme [Veillonellales bacterium]